MYDGGRRRLLGLRSLFHFERGVEGLSTHVEKKEEYLLFHRILQCILILAPKHH